MGFAETMFALLPALVVAVPVCLVAFFSGSYLIKHGPRDVPSGGHKQHAEAKPTAGGIAVCLAALPGFLAVWVIEPGWINPTIIGILFGSFLMFLMGLWDDLVALPALPKLAGQIVVALAVAFVGARVEYFDVGRHLYQFGFLFGLIGSAAWLVVVTNAANFMDGADGLAMGISATIAAGLAILAAVTGAVDTASYAIVLFAALMGLLFWNGQGKLFAGDTGALFVGFLLGALTLQWISELELSVWLAPCLFLAFLADVLLTLIWRMRRGRSLLSPHREHIYQIALKAGARQHVVAWSYIWITVHGCLFAGLSFLFPRGVAMVSFGGLVAILLVVSNRIRAAAIRHGNLDP